NQSNRNRHKPPRQWTERHPLHRRLTTHPPIPAHPVEPYSPSEATGIRRPRASSTFGSNGAPLSDVFRRRKKKPRQECPAAADTFVCFRLRDFLARAQHHRAAANSRQASAKTKK